MKRILLYLFIVTTLTACYPITRASGIIYDEHHTPLQNVLVRVTGRSVKLNKAKLEQITKSDGKYNFDEFHVSAENPIEIKLVIQKNGYKTLTKQLKFNKDNVDEIILESEKQ